MNYRTVTWDERLDADLYRALEGNRPWDVKRLIEWPELSIEMRTFYTRCVSQYLWESFFNRVPVLRREVID